jgi:hypothetical protein
MFIFHLPTRWWPARHSCSQRHNVGTHALDGSVTRQRGSTRALPRWWLYGTTSKSHVAKSTMLDKSHNVELAAGPCDHAPPAGRHNIAQFPLIASPWTTAARWRGHQQRDSPLACAVDGGYFLSSKIGS